jgi:anaerobic selenocysteine-containing dehydrogenase
MSQQNHYRTCNLCEAMCGLVIELEGNEITSIKGDKNDPLSRGHICPKALALKDLHLDPDRLQEPMRKKGDRWEKISWEEAFGAVEAGIKRIQKKYGHDAVAIYQGNPSVHNLGTMLYAGDMVRSLRTQNRYSATSVDQLPHHLASLEMYGHMNLLPIPDLDHTDYLLIMGGNPLASNGSMMTAPDIGRRLRAIQKRGGKVVVIDPRRTETAHKASEHLFIRPGTDVALLLAMVQVITTEDKLEPGRLAAFTEGLDALPQIVEDFTPEWASGICGIEAADIRKLALDFAQAKRAICYGRMGLSVVEFGGLSNWLINVLNLVTGNLDRVGGVLFTKPAADLVARSRGERKTGRWRSRVRHLPEIGGELPASALAEEIMTPGEGQIKALITSCGNPVLSTPNGTQLDEALAGLEFMVSIDIYLNETTRHADLILPPATGLENSHYDLIFHGLAIRNTSKYSEALYPISESQRYDWQIYKEITHRLTGKEVSPFPVWMRWFKGDNPENRLDALLRTSGHKLSLKKLKAHPHGLDLGPLVPSLPERLKRKDKKIRLLPELFVNDLDRLREKWWQKKGQVPEFLLIGRRHLRSNNSWMHNSQRLVKGPDRCTLMIHPEDARKLEIEESNEILVRSRVGEVQLKVELSGDIMPGVVSIPHGWGHGRSGTQLQVANENKGVSINDLTDELALDELSGNAILNGVPVELVPVSEVS